MNFEEYLNFSGTEINLNSTRSNSAIINAFEKFLFRGGFPEPFIKNDPGFLNRWETLRQEQLIREDIRDLSRIQEIGQIEILAEILKNQTG